MGFFVVVVGCFKKKIQRKEQHTITLLELYSLPERRLRCVAEGGTSRR